MLSAQAPHASVLDEVKDLADRLGERRDPDVAIEELEELAERFEPADRPGVAGLVEELRAEQATANDTVARALAEVHDSGPGTSGCRSWPRRRGREGPAGQGPGSRRRVRRQRAADRDGSGVDELYALAPKALDVERPKKLHDLRIAAKRLRYVLEIARPALGKGATDGVRTAKALQQLLGDIHDCDEMLPRVQAHAERLRAGTWTSFAAAPGATLVTSSRSWLRPRRAPTTTAGWRRWPPTWPPAARCCSPASSASGSGWRRATSAARC